MKFLRKLLFPFSLLYWGITTFRNLLYNRGWLKSKAYDLPIICVGNLSTGGTGKSPMIEFLINILKDNYKVGVLSRGYKRKTKGFKEVFVNSTVLETGDEPLQFKRKFPEVIVAVCEDRQTGIEHLKNRIDLLLLDDAFQHRKVKPSFSVVLTTYDNLYVNDCILPVGNLREAASGAKRADIIVVTKCPKSIDNADMNVIREKIHPKGHQKVFFSTIGYASHIQNEEDSFPLSFLDTKKITLVTGIANPKPLVSFLNSKGLNFVHKEYGDHHHFSTSELIELEKENLLLTTEKDYMRLKPVIKSTPLYYLPITTEFLNGGKEAFINRILARKEMGIK